MLMGNREQKHIKLIFYTIKKAKSYSFLLYDYIIVFNFQKNCISVIVM